YTDEDSSSMSTERIDASGDMRSAGLDRVPRLQLRSIHDGQGTHPRRVATEPVPSWVGGAPASLDPSLAPVVTASPEEIRYAEQLRQPIERRYLNRPNRPVS